MAHAGSGRDPYSNARFFVKHIRTGWVDGQKHLRGNRHYQTLRRCMPSFDHVIGMSHRKYELCTRETNSAKSFMSPAQFVDLCARVTRHQAGRISGTRAGSHPAGARRRASDRARLTAAHMTHRRRTMHPHRQQLPCAGPR